MSSTPDTLFQDLLDRHVAIQKWIADPLRDGHFINAVSQLLWTPQGPDSLPCCANYNAGFQLEVYSKDYWNIRARVGVRLLAGQIGAGAVGQYENALNSLIMAVVNQYARFDHLQTPDASGNPTWQGEFIYLAAGDTPVVPGRNSGLTPYRYGKDASGQPMLFFGTEFIVECALRVKRK